MSDEETLLWEGHPAHIKDLGFHIVCLVLFPLVVPALFSLSRYLRTRFTKYEVTTERLRITKGILSTRMEETELYRVRDTTLEQPFFLRLFSLSNILLKSTDASTPMVTLEAIPDGRVLRENLRGAVEKMRAKRGVRTIEA
jgi:uncharacterized membrane protein YdbT with pleckstrin-like domain